MPCRRICHDIYCHDDKEHPCHDATCHVDEYDPMRSSLEKVKDFFQFVAKRGKGLSHTECQDVLTELSKYV